MRRLWFVALPILIWAACLEPGAPLLARLDETPPSVLSTVPPITDGGTLSSLPAGSPIEITFSEEMDIRTLRPGISVLKRNRVPPEELSLLVTVPPPGPPLVQDLDRPYLVRVYPNGQTLLPDNTNYSLVLRTLLADAQGNALPEEIQIRFRITP